MANDGSALGSLARIKQQIILDGGVLTSLGISPAFESYTATSRVIDGDIPENEVPNWHAVFCYGYTDNPRGIGEGHWLCKNRWVRMYVTNAAP
jgi:hypothetical protein